MSGSLDVEATLIGVGTVIAILFVVYGRYLGGTVVDIDATIIGAWVFAATFAAVALAHGLTGRYDLAGGHGGAAAGWVLVLIAETGPQMGLGLLVLILSGVYVVVVTLRDRREAAVPVEST